MVTMDEGRIVFLLGGQGGHATVRSLGGDVALIGDESQNRGRQDEEKHGEMSLRGLSILTSSSSAEAHYRLDKENEFRL